MNPRARGASAAAPRHAAGAPPRIAPGARVLLLGIGNDLRGDDGAGPRVARALAGRVPWDVRVAHGLTPELADDLARCDLTLFVDAGADPSLVRPRWKLHGAPGASPAPGAPATPSPLLGHALDARALLALTALLHGRAPAAATLALPARDFALGESLTRVAETGARAAVDELLSLECR